MPIFQNTRCLVDSDKRARVRSRFSSCSAEQEYKVRVVLARQLRKQKKGRPTWTIKGLAKLYTADQLANMLGTVRMPG